jgi:hypothetical protein
MQKQMTKHRKNIMTKVLASISISVFAIEKCHENITNSMIASFGIYMLSVRCHARVMKKMDWIMASFGTYCTVQSPQLKTSECQDDNYI